MILDELVLQNVGTFAGRNRIELTPASDAEPIILVGGLNGAGKTTFLEAIHLALYGTFAQAGSRRSGSYDKYLKSLTHRGISAGSISSVELTFRAHQQGNESTYRIIRSWDGTGSSVQEHLEIDIDGRLDKGSTATWAEHVETFLPRGIAGLFFFDGEQIEALADLQKSREVLGTALSALLGLDLVDRLGTDLSVLRRRHRVNQVPESLKAKVEGQKKLVITARQAEEQALDAAASARVDLERCEKKHFELTEHYRSAGGELLDNRVSTERDVENHMSAISLVDAEIREEASDAAPLLLLPLLLDELETQVRNESNAVSQRIIAEELGARDQTLVRLLREGAVSGGVVEEVALFLAADRQRRADEGTVVEVTGLPDSTQVSYLRTSALPNAARRLQKLLERRNSHRAELDQLERVLVAMPDPEALSDTRRQMEAVVEQLIRQQATVAMVEENLEACRAERSKAEANYESELDRLAQTTMSIDDDMRILAHVDKVRSTLESLRSAATRRYLGKIGDLVLEALQRLLRKEALVKAVSIDPDNYTVELTGDDGAAIQSNQLSAGERQLLAVSLLWGLARASGQPLPVVVDTPLGRLDGSHREHLVDRYFPYASHQVILLSTDTEIDEATYGRMKKFVGRSYQLVFDQERNATSVEPGYFWK